MKHTAKHIATGIYKSGPDGEEFIVLKRPYSSKHGGQYLCAKRFSMSDTDGNIIEQFKSPAWLTIFSGYIRHFPEPIEVEIEE